MTGETEDKISEYVDDTEIMSGDNKRLFEITVRTMSTLEKKIQVSSKMRPVRIRRNLPIRDTSQLHMEYIWNWEPT